MALFSPSSHLGLAHSREGISALALAARGGGRWSVEALWHLPWRQEGVRGREEQLQAAREWIAQEKLSRRGDALCLLPQPQATTVISDFPPIREQEKLAQVVSYQTGQLSGLSGVSLVNAFCPVAPLPGQTNPQLVAVTREGPLEDWCLFYQESELALQGMTPGGVALYNALALLQPGALARPGLQMVLDWDGEEDYATLLILSQGALPFLGVLDSPSSQPAELAQQLQGALRSWRATQVGDGALTVWDRLWFSGEAAAREGLADSLADLLKISVEPLGLPQASCPHQGGGTAIGGVLPAMALPFGLAAQSAGLAPLPITLLPTRLAWQKKRTREFPFLALAAILLTAFLSWLFVDAIARVQREEGEVQQEEKLLDECLATAPELHDARQELLHHQKRLLPVAEASLRTRRFVQSIRAWDQSRPVPREGTWCIYLADEFSFAEDNAPRAGSSPAPSSRRSEPSPLRPAAEKVLLRQEDTGASPAASSSPAPMPTTATPVSTLPLLTRMYAGGILPAAASARFQAVKEFQGELNRSQVFTNVDDYTDFLSEEFLTNHFAPWSSFLGTYRNMLKRDYTLFLLQLPFLEFPVSLPQSAPRPRS
ncbi:MAG: hypothetical protein ACI4SG_02175 [Oligosphaeraceae bacterium]